MCVCIIWNPELRADIIYRDTEYQDFPIPRLVFGLRILENGKVAECSMGVVADEKPTEDIWTFTAEERELVHRFESAR